MTESRNEIARKASKNRRDNEAVEVQRLTELLPLPQDVKTHLDKESIIRLVIAYIRLRQYVQQDSALNRKCLTYPCASRSKALEGSSPRSPSPRGPQPVPASADVGVCPSPSDTRPEFSALPQAASASGPVGAEAASDAGIGAGSSVWQQWIKEGQLLLEALRGFLVLVSKRGKVLYVSETVEEYLGISQAWMLGRAIVEFIHPEDVKDLSRQFDLSAKRVSGVSPSAKEEKEDQESCGYTYSTARNFYLRMRHYPNGAGARKKPGNYLVVHWSGELRVRHSSHAGANRPRVSGMVCVCRPLQSNSILHIPLGGNMFISRHDMRLAFTYCDPRVLFLIGYDPSYLIGRTAYHFHNPVDAHKCSDCHNELIKRGTSVSQYYRFLGRTGVWVWMQTKATIITNTRGQPQYVVCNNYIISQKEGERTHQMELQQALAQSSQTMPGGDLTAKGAIDLQPLSQVTSPVSCTDSEHEVHDDTGYSSAVSSMGSASASPSPLSTAGAGSGAEGDPCASSSSSSSSAVSHPLLEVPLLEKGAGKTLVAAGLGFHSTLSSAIYGEELNVQGLSGPVPSLAGPYTAGGLLGEFGSDPSPPSLSNERSDPFLCGSSSSGQGHSEGGNSNVVDMELLEDLLERFADCDSSQDSVFTHSPPPQAQGGSSAFLADAHAAAASEPVKSSSVLMGNSQPQLQRNLSSEPGRQPSLLRTLLDKEGKALNECPPRMKAWTAKQFPPAALSSNKTRLGAVGPAAAAALTRVKALSAGRECVTVANSKDQRRRSTGPQHPTVCWPRGRGGKQLLVCGERQVLVPRQVDLTQDSGDSDEGEETEEEPEVKQEEEEVVKQETEQEEEKSQPLESDNLPPSLPDDLLDFAMQYCDSLCDMDTMLPEGMSGLEDEDVWSSTVEDLMATDSSSQVPRPVPLNATRKAARDVPNRTVSERGSQECSGESLPISRPSSTLSASPALQSTVISNALKALKPGFTISVRPAPPGGVKGLVIQPLTKEKSLSAAMLKSPAAASSVDAKCMRLLSPVLSDHRYSSQHPQSPVSSHRPPCGKRMRTDGDSSKSAPRVGGKGPGAGKMLLRSAGEAFPSPKTPSHKSVSSPRSRSSSPGRSPSVSGDSSPSSLPTSPILPPIPANGGGKPLNAMSELEKHLRGLVAPPDERQNELEDILPPVEECTQSGSRPFLERLLTGEISHERYRQIDYHLLYQERERRLSENGQAS